ncbi:hypothetical protein QWY14_14200 [Planococcus sp. N028]|uniref:Uncharacterized protein n=1 Tax=Planococcus shixiaomingii TaxID=3058393 RepID=A0ABT8N5D9_9BACL|nr:MULTISPECIES: hypothetical protein [unclassified Planococcus (in: firmicutes)]MDN7242963.1 hypothetical protein [Planococcus sp. N028]WKA55411.1 hypothetical protein QWY21_03250 [Planococcus sp. N022]
MTKEQPKKRRSWLPDVLIEIGGVLFEIILLVPRVVIRIVKDIT